MTFAVVIVHGMGAQRRNEVVAGFTEQIVEMAESRGSRGRPGVKAKVGDLGSAEFEVAYGNETWRFVEYYWADMFKPPGVGPTYEWIAERLTAHVGSLQIGLAKAIDDIEDAKSGGPHDPDAALVYQRKAAGRYRSLLRAFHRFPKGLASALKVLHVFSHVPGVSGMVVKLLNGFAVGYLGDIYVYFENEVQAAMIKGGLEQFLLSLGADSNVDRIIVFAHSTGAPIE